MASYYIKLPLSSGGSGAGVDSFNGRFGIVVSVSGDYSGSQITNTPAGNIAATDVQAAINELDSEKLAIGASAGGDLTGTYPSPTLIAVGTAGTKGSASAVPVFVTDTKGRVTSNTDTPISITASQVSDFNEAAQDAVGSILTDSTSIDFTYDDAGGSISAAVLYGTPVTQNPDQANNAGTANTAARSDHVHNIPADVPSNTGSANSEGVSSSFARADHVHNTTLVNNEVKTTTLFTTSSLTDVVITSFTTTPAAGTYFVSISCSASHNTNNSLGTLSIYSNGTQVTTTERVVNFQGSTRQDTLGSQCIVTVNGSEAIDARVRTSAGTLSITNRSLIVVRLGS